MLIQVDLNFYFCIVKQFLILLFLFSVGMISAQQEFLDAQLTNERVAIANSEKYKYLVDLFASKTVEFPCDSIYFRAMKWNKKLEVWAWSKDSSKYVLINSYNICMLSGELGPKREQGDQQIPEGFYQIVEFNPMSKYFLSLGINYPNESDKVFGTQGALGGDIYIHGGCETIGCLPMTDAMMKEIYLIALYAKGSGQLVIPVHIYPTKLTKNNFVKLKENYFKGSTTHINFWSQIKQGYDYFEKYKRLPRFNIVDGNYLLIND